MDLDNISELRRRSIVGSRLKSARHRAKLTEAEIAANGGKDWGLTQAMLAKRVGVDKGTISRIEREAALTSNASAGLIMALEAALNVNGRWLFGFGKDAGPLEYLTDQERKLLTIYRELSTAGRETFLATAAEAGEADKLYLRLSKPKLNSQHTDR